MTPAPEPVEIPISVKLTADAEDAIRSIIRDELATLGGHLLATYGRRLVRTEDSGVSTAPSVGYIDPGCAALAALGGYLLAEYGDGPPAVGEPTTTTPSGDA